MDCFTDVLDTSLLSLEGQRALRLICVIKNIVIFVPKNEGLTGLERHEGV